MKLVLRFVADFLGCTVGAVVTYLLCDGIGLPVVATSVAIAFGTIGGLFIAENVWEIVLETYGDDDEPNS